MADTRNRLMLQEADVQLLLEKLQSLKDTIVEVRQTLKKDFADMREGFADMREGFADMRGALRLTIESLHDTKISEDSDSTNECESHDTIESSYTMTHCVPQSQVPNSIMEHSHRFCSRSLDVCEDLPYAYAIVGNDQRRQKLSLLLKSWKFKFKGKFEAEFCSGSHSGLDFDVGVTTGGISMDEENCCSGVKKSYMKHKWRFKYKLNTWFSEELRFSRKNIYEKMQVWHRWKNKAESLYAFSFLIGVDKQQSSSLLRANQIWDPGGIFSTTKATKGFFHQTT